VLVGEEASADDLDVPQRGCRHLGPEPLEHDGRDVDGHDSAAGRGDGQGELAGAGTQIHHLGTAVKSELDEQRHFDRGAGVLLLVIAGNVVAIHVLPPCTAHLVEQPAGRSRATSIEGHRQSLAPARSLLR